MKSVNDFNIGDKVMVLKNKGVGTVIAKNADKVVIQYKGDFVKGISRCYQYKPDDLILIESVEKIVDKLVKAYDLIKESHRMLKSVNHDSESTLKDIRINLGRLLSSLILPEHEESKKPPKIGKQAVIQHLEDALILKNSDSEEAWNIIKYVYEKLID